MGNQKYYLDKFGRKMRGSSKSTAKGWVKGTGKALTPKQKKSLWIKIKRKYY